MREDTVREHKEAEKEKGNKGTEEKWTLTQTWKKPEKKEVHVEEDAFCTR